MKRQENPGIMRPVSFKVSSMAAPKGNQYWKIRSKSGRDKKYTPRALLRKANEYFEFCVDNPLYKTEVVRGKDGAELVEVPVMRVFSIEGFCVFADISVPTFYSYSQQEDFIKVTTRIRNTIENQQMEGASANLLNANIIARRLGLVDRHDHTTGGEKIQYTPIWGTVDNVLKDDAKEDDGGG